jgi:acetylglutamate kinase
LVAVLEAKPLLSHSQFCSAHSLSHLLCTMFCLKSSSLLLPKDELGGVFSCPAAVRILAPSKPQLVIPGRTWRRKSSSSSSSSSVAVVQGLASSSSSSSSAQPSTAVVKKNGLNFSGKERVDVLAEALPFIQRFQGKTVVVKYGGAAMKDESLKERVIKDLVLLSCVGLRPVLVHGGGPEINQWLNKLGIEPEFKNGLRVTDAATMEVVEMVLVGKVSASVFCCGF